MEHKTSAYGKLKTATWIAGITLLILGAYVNWGMPHGPMIKSGETCYEDAKGSGSCGDRYVEDTRRVDIPDWAKYLREHGGGMFALFLILTFFFEYQLIGRSEDSWPHIRDLK